ncbi:MAG: hypothetical protein WC532_02900 [Candidatus Omnitrophota bacterium]
MKYAQLRRLQEKPYFTIANLANIAGISLESARVLASRYVKSGVFIRLKNNFYVLDQNWGNFRREDFFALSNYLQVPSYISLMTALSFYEVTTQSPRNFFESISLKRSQRFEIKGVIFNYHKVKKTVYFDFIRKDNIFIATKEKAFMDAVYLFSFGKYKLDFASLNIERLDMQRLKKIIKAYPLKTRQIAGKICGIS